MGAALVPVLAGVTAATSVVAGIAKIAGGSGGDKRPDLTAGQVPIGEQLAKSFAKGPQDGLAQRENQITGAPTLGQALAPNIGDIKNRLARLGPQVGIQPNGRNA